MDNLCVKFGFVQHNSSMYNAVTNGIEEALWAYRTTYRTPTLATPYSFVYGIEVVLPLECQIPYLRSAIQEGLNDEENTKLRLEELEALDEKRLKAQQCLECYKANMPIVITLSTSGKFISKWGDPYAVTEVYKQGA
ncbi:hypothetical protein DKX38_029354 [Salix brachista]|uniref:Uncharacterized protein n=1 Tax=Salix brachista TaxID=2182728 RepID=A0A5N5J1D3_9ROSI|nr:hypothetical protein DKX38_029354 [Salix brachista]